MGNRRRLAVNGGLVCGTPLGTIRRQSDALFVPSGKVVCCRQPREVDLMELQLSTGLDVRHRAAQQDMYAAVVLAGQQQGQQRVADETGRTGEQGGEEKGL